MAVWLGCGPERPQFSRVGVAVWLGCGPERCQFSRVGVAVWVRYGPERLLFSEVGWGGPGSGGESWRRHQRLFAANILSGP